VNQLFLIVYTINQEAIAGKCSVVCTSKDSRNPKVSDEELQKADFIFYRAFDVKDLKILDQIEEKVAGIEGITFSFFLSLLFFFFLLIP
jgi:hypothetical protein